MDSLSDPFCSSCSKCPHYSTFQLQWRGQQWSGTGQHVDEESAQLQQRRRSSRERAGKRRRTEFSGLGGEFDPEALANMTAASDTAGPELLRELAKLGAGYSRETEIAIQRKVGRQRQEQARQQQQEAPQQRAAGGGQARTAAPGAAYREEQSR